MRRNVPSKTKEKVINRASARCEYCKMSKEDSFLPFEIDHIVSIKHGGGNEFENLAYSRLQCNKHKGSDLTTFVDLYDNIVLLFNPRKHIWENHFYAEDGIIYPKTEIGKATIKLLQLNNPEVIVYRAILQDLDRYP